MRAIWRIKFRTSPDEFVYVHGVPVILGAFGHNPTMDKAFCGREVPAAMQNEPDAFDWAINKDLVNCPECGQNAMAMIRNPDYAAGAAA